MSEDFEDRIRRDLASIAENVPAGTSVSPTTDNPSRRSPVLVAAVALSTLVFAGVLAWLAAMNGGDSGSDPAATTLPVDDVSTTTTLGDATEGDEPPPSENGAHRIWMSTDTVSRDGTDVTFAIAGPEITPFFGASTAIDRWTGGSWEPLYDGFGVCGLDWSCSLTEPSVADVVMSFDHGVASRETLHLAGLDDGWYRLRKTIEGTPATAVFRSVAPGLAPDLAPSLPFDGSPTASITVTPVVVDSRGSTLSVAHTYNDTNANAVLVDVEVHRWEGTEWRPLLAIELGVTPPYEALLPALSPGEYRLIAGGELESRFWVADGISTVPPCHTSLDLGLGASADGPQPPTVEMRRSRIGFRAEWTVGDQIVRYSYPVGGVTDLLGERTVVDGLVMLWFRDTQVEAWVSLPECGDQDAVTAGIEVSGGSPEANIALAREVGQALAREYQPAWMPPLPNDACPDETTPPPDTPNVVHTIWLYCGTAEMAEAELVPVHAIFSPDDPIPEVVRRGLGNPPDGMETAIPVELRLSVLDLQLVDGRLTVRWSWDLGEQPINNLSTSYWSARIIDQIAANAFQFDEIEEIDLSYLPVDHGGEFVYTRAQWESTQGAD